MAAIARPQDRMQHLLAKLRRRNRHLALVAIFLAIFLAVVLALIVGYGLLRGPVRAARVGPMDAQELEDLKRQVISASYSERIRLLHRLQESGGIGAEETLIEMLQRASTDRVRLKAISLLRRIGSDRAVDALMQFLPSARRAIGIKIIETLGQIGSERAVTSLLDLLQDEDGDHQLDAHLKRTVVLALGEAGGGRAEATLIHLAQQPDELSRQAAISALAAVGTAKAIRVLSRLATDRSPAVHQAAIQALGKAGTDQARDTLLHLAQEGNRPIRSKVVWALANYSDDVTQQLLISLSGGPDREVAHNALRALGQMDGPLARQALLEATQSNDPRVQAIAASALADSGSPEAEEALIHQLHTGRDPYQAAQALATMQDPRAREALLHMAQNGSMSTQRAVVWALGSVHGGGAEVDQVLGELITHASPQVATAALSQLARRQGKAALPLLIQSYREGSSNMQASALQALAAIDDPASRKLIMEAVSSGVSTLTHQGIQALVTMDGPKATDTLIGLLQQDDRHARMSAASALAQIGGPRAREALIQSLKEGQETQGMAWILGQMTDAETTTQLSKLIEDNSVSKQVKQQVVEALGHGAKADALLKAAAHPDEEIASAALMGLGSIGGPEAETSLLNALTSTQGPMKQAALVSLAKLGTPHAVTAIQQSLHDTDLKDGAVSALAQIGNKRALDALVDHYQSAGDSDRTKIVRHLAYQPNARSRRLLVQALDDVNENVAALAAGALARTGGSQHSSRLVSLLESGGSRKVRYAIASALRWSNSSLYRRHRELINQIYSEGG